MAQAASSSSAVLCAEICGGMAPSLTIAATIDPDPCGGYLSVDVDDADGRFAVRDDKINCEEWLSAGASGGLAHDQGHVINSAGLHWIGPSTIGGKGSQRRTLAGLGGGISSWGALVGSPGGGVEMNCLRPGMGHWPVQARTPSVSDIAPVKKAQAATQSHGFQRQGRSLSGSTTPSTRRAGAPLSGPATIRFAFR